MAAESLNEVAGASLPTMEEEHEASTPGDMQQHLQHAEASFRTWKMNKTRPPPPPLPASPSQQEDGRSSSCNNSKQEEVVLWQELYQRQERQRQQLRGCCKLGNISSSAAA